MRPAPIAPARARAAGGGRTAWLAAGLCLLLLAPAAPARAATLLDPTDLIGAGRIRLDAAANAVFDRDLHVDGVAEPQGADTERFVLSGTYGLVPELDAFLTLGASRLSITDDPSGAGGGFDGSLGFAFGGGLRYRFIDEAVFKVGAQLSLERLESDDGDVKATWLEADALVATSLHVFRSLVPYVGLGASILSGDFTAPAGQTPFRQEHVVGAVAGLRYLATSQVSATLAGRFFDQTAIAFTLSFGF